jgi:hypothetical protein
MSKILVKAIVDENHRVTLELPDVPAGEILLHIEVVPDPDRFEPYSREWIHAKLRLAGVLVEETFSDEELADLEGYEVLSDEEEEEFGRLLADPKRSTLDLIE